GNGTDRRATGSGRQSRQDRDPLRVEATAWGLAQALRHGAGARAAGRARLDPDGRRAGVREVRGASLPDGAHLANPAVESPLAPMTREAPPSRPAARSSFLAHRVMVSFTSGVISRVNRRTLPGSCLWTLSSRWPFTAGQSGKSSGHNNGGFRLWGGRYERM